MIKRTIKWIKTIQPIWSVAHAYPLPVPPPVPKPKTEVICGMNVYLCCGQAPAIMDYSPYHNPQTLIKTEVVCETCGDHIHSTFAIQGALDIWNRKREK